MNKTLKSAITYDTGLEIVALVVSIPDACLSFEAVLAKHVFSLVPPLHACVPVHWMCISLAFPPHGGSVWVEKPL